MTFDYMENKCEDYFFLFKLLGNLNFEQIKLKSKNIQQQTRAKLKKGGLKFSLVLLKLNSNLFLKI